MVFSGSHINAFMLHKTSCTFCSLPLNVTMLAAVINAAANGFGTALAPWPSDAQQCAPEAVSRRQYDGDATTGGQEVIVKSPTLSNNAAILLSVWELDSGICYSEILHVSGARNGVRMQKISLFSPTAFLIIHYSVQNSLGE